MAIKVSKGTITASTTNAATSAVDLSAIFSGGDPLRAIIFWCSNNTANGVVGADLRYSIGFATNDGGTIQQGYTAAFSDDAAANALTSRAINTTSALSHNSAQATVDLDMDVTTFTSTGFTVTWTNAPGTAIIVHYMAIGGADVSAARVFNFQCSTAAATQDVTINAGFGQPNLLFFAHTQNTALGTANNSWTTALSCAKSATERRTASMGEINDGGTMLMHSWHGDRALTVVAGEQGAATNAIDLEADLSTLVNWPTDGFELTYTDQASIAYRVMGLALKGTFSATIDNNVALTSGSTQDNAHSTTPVGALLWGTNLPVTAGLDQTHADLGSFVIGGTDFTNEGCAGAVQDDANTTSTTSTFHTDAKVIQFYQPAATATIASEADSSISGSNMRLTWTDLDTVARDYSYVILGSGSSPHVVAVGQTTETNTSQSITRVKTKAVGQTTETDTSQADTHRKTKTLGQPAETNTSQAITHSKIKAIGLTTETELAQAITHVKTKVLGQSAEINTSQPVTVNPKRRLIIQITETDLSQTLTRIKSKTLGQNTETDTSQHLTNNPQRRLVNQRSETNAAQPLTHVKTKTIGQVTETDVSQTIVHNKSKTLGQTTETDLSQAVAHSKVKAIGQSAETDTSQAIVKNPQRRLVNQATENNLSQVVTHLKTKTIAQATENDLSQSINKSKSKTVGLITETDLSQTLTSRKSKTLGQSTETDLAQHINNTGNKNIAVGQASETDLSQPITRRKTRALGQTTESNTAQPIAHSISKAVGQATEFDLSQALTARKTKATGQAAETELSQSVTLRRTITLAQASEIDLAQTFTSKKSKAIGQSSESDLSQTIRPKRTYSISQSSETDLAQSITRRKLKLLGLSLESDSAFGIVLPPSLPDNLHDICHATISEFKSRTSEFYISIVDITQSTQSVSSIVAQITSGLFTGGVKTSGTISQSLQGVGNITQVKTQTGLGEFSVVVVIDQKVQQAEFNQFQTNSIEGYDVIVMIDESIRHITNLNEYISKALSRHVSSIDVNTSDQNVVVTEHKDVVYSSSSKTGVTIIP